MIIKKILFAVFLLFALYMVMGYLLDQVIFREKLPEISMYFKPGDIFRSNEEGLSQKVTSHKEGMVFCDIILDPYAPGPPKHIHTGFDELFEAGEKGLHLVVGNDTVKLKPFESFLVKKGIPHKPFNPTGEVIYLSMTKSGFPEKFAFGLVQVYGYMDEKPLNQRSTTEIMMQFSRFSQIFDSWLAEDSPPVTIQKMMFFILRPWARLKGYKTWYPKYQVKKENQENIRLSANQNIY